MGNMYRVVTSHSVVMSKFRRNYLSITVPDIFSSIVLDMERERRLDVFHFTCQAIVPLNQDF